MIIPKSRKGVMSISLPPLRFGQKKQVTKLELTDELQARIDAIRSDKEYQKRKACHDLGRDLFIEEAQKAIAAAGIVRQPSAAAVSEAKKVEEAAAAAAPAVKVVIAHPVKSKQLKRPVVLMAGGTDWDRIGKADKTSEEAASYNLATPHVIAALSSVRVQRIATSNSSAHCIAITETHQCFVWGRNECGQLGLGHKESVETPTLMKACKDDIVAAACGKEHSVFITSAGGVLSAGSKERGAIGAWEPGGKQDFANAVQLAEECIDVSCGTDFTIVVTKSGAAWSWGWTENGCLGHGDDGCFNQSASSIKLTFTAEKQPKRIAALAESTIVQVSCGARHCAALADDGVVFTWGCGDYGRLGHQKQEDVSVRILQTSTNSPIHYSPIHHATLQYTTLRAKTNHPHPCLSTFRLLLSLCHSLPFFRVVFSFPDPHPNAHSRFHRATGGLRRCLVLCSRMARATTGIRPACKPGPPCEHCTDVHVGESSQGHCRRLLDVPQA
jgi:hypothetical protein